MKNLASSSSRSLTTDEQISRFLGDNPKIKESLEVFNMSLEEYKKAINSTIQKPIITTFNTTNQNGNVAGDRN